MPAGRPPRPKSDQLPRKPGQKGSPESKATAEAKERFLVAFAELGSLSGAARLAGRNTRNVYSWRDRDPEFREKYEGALAEATSKLEAEAWRRAVEGTERPVVSAGKVVTTVREYSDSLLALLLKAAAPERYRPPKDPKVSVHSDGPITVTLDITGERRARETETIEGEASRLIEHDE